jgi:hypothetical protein
MDLSPRRAWWVVVVVCEGGVGTKVAREGGAYKRATKGKARILLARRR